MKNFTLQKTSLKNLKLLISHPFMDERGSFNRLFCQNTLQKFTNKKIIQQVNHTLTKKKGHC